MGGTTSPRWGSGFKPVVNNPLPASFVTFFPAAHEAKTEISWADKLVAQKSATLLPAWCRVPVAAGPSTLRKGMTIMKRVGRSANSCAVRPQQMMAASQIAEDTEEAQRANRRRLDSFVSPADDALLELVGEPLSRAEVASAIMRAKVDVANCYLHEEYSDVSDQRSLAKQTQYSKKTVPMKRRFNDHSSISFEYASGGNGAAIYSELDPIVSRAMQTGVTEIDVNMASITEVGAHLRSTRRNPRISLAASGMPELSDISDATEPSSILTLEPNESMTDAKSPTKRASTQSPSPTKSIKSFRKRLSDTIVRLLPVSSPRAEPSPVKSPSPPTPSKDSESPRERTPSISIPKSPTASRSPLPLSANSTPGLVRWSSRPSRESPFSRWRPKRKSEPTLRSSTTPSPYRNETSPTLDAMEERSIVYESPLHQSRPKAPTPSKWSGLHSSTPSEKSPSTAAKLADSRASLELVKSLPEWMQHNGSPTTLEQYDPGNIDFRPTSPSFTNSVSWVNSPTDAIESERTKIVRRRKSEPLARNMLKSQTSRRMSLSPQKSIRSGGARGALFTIDEPTFPHEDAISQIPEHSQASELFNPLATQSDTTNAITEQTEDMDMDFGSLSWDYKARIEETLRERRNAPPPVRHADDVFDDPNDRYRRESPPPADPIKRLARMAENGCYDQAGVMVVKEDGRLFVRFKLPLKYAHMFPNNQGDTSSYYSHSSPVPQSPILRFLREAPAEAPDESPYDHPGTREPRPRSEWSTTPEGEESHPADKTLVVSDFGDSPARRSSLSAVNEESHLAGGTLVVSDFGGSLTKRSSLSPEIDESYPSDATLVVSDFGSSPVKRNPSSCQGIVSTSSAPTLPKYPYTPDGQTITPSYVESPIEEASRPPLNSDSSSLSDLENTPPLNPSSELSIANNMATANGEEDQSTNTRATSSPADSITVNAPPSTSPISFTPVNQASAQKKSTPSSTRSTKQSPSTNQEAGEPYPNTCISHDDTPERDFLRDFIRRSKPRRPSTTETGSPIAPGQRLPLGARSPNMETQPKEKRKFENSEGEENEDESENKPEPAAKRVRRHRATPPKPKSVATADHTDDEDPLAKDMTAATAVNTADTTEEQEEAPAAAVSRRSSRLKAKPSGIPKSSIPAPTKVGRGRPPSSTLGSVRNEQQDLVHQTRANTRRNKGNAEYPAQVLAKQSEEGDANAAAVGQQDEAEASKARRGKSVVWKEPLADYQEEEKPKRGRPVKAKAKPVGNNRVSKPATKPSAAAQKQRSTRIAAGLGMAGNGTPAPKRATRASTRTRK
ncbi:hypothetical protein V8C42DRAFT_327392 [Trichoderma barbatum]